MALGRLLKSTIHHPAASVSAETRLMDTVPPKKAFVIECSCAGLIRHPSIFLPTDWRLLMFNRKPKNEKWETIRRRELRNDIIGAVVLVPVMYVWVVLMCCL